jgi:hypothetical protein
MSDEEISKSSRKKVFFDSDPCDDVSHTSSVNQNNLEEEIFGASDDEELSDFEELGVVLSDEEGNEFGSFHSFFLNL